MNRAARRRCAWDASRAIAQAATSRWVDGRRANSVQAVRHCAREPASRKGQVRQRSDSAIRRHNVFQLDAAIWIARQERYTTRRLSPSNVGSDRGQAKRIGPELRSAVAISPCSELARWRSQLALITLQTHVAGGDAKQCRRGLPLRAAETTMPINDAAAVQWLAGSPAPAGVPSSMRPELRARAKPMAISSSAALSTQASRSLAIERDRQLAGEHRERRRSLDDCVDGKRHADQPRPSNTPVISADGGGVVRTCS